jgi:hypothetical protein
MTQSNAPAIRSDLENPFVLRRAKAGRNRRMNVQADFEMGSIRWFIWDLPLRIATGVARY